jgi:hypothetical protein
MSLLIRPIKEPRCVHDAMLVYAFSPYALLLLSKNRSGAVLFKDQTFH